MKREALTGLFWMSGDEATKIPGTLNVEDGGTITLVTREEFSPIHDPGLLGTPGVQRFIFGLIGSEHVKLVRCNLVKEASDDGLYGIKRESVWHCRYALIGDCYKGEVPGSITSAEIRFALPTKWLPDPLGTGEDFTGFAWDLFQLHKRLQQPAHWNLGTVSIAPPSHAAVKPVGTAYSDLDGPAQSALRLEFDTPQPFASMNNAVSTLQVLLSVATGKAAAIDELSVTDTEFDPVQFSLYYRTNLRIVGQGMSHPGLFEYSEIQGTDGMARWLNLLQDQTSLKQALVIDQFHEPALTSDRTNHLLMACEAYMRNRRLADRQANEFPNLPTILRPMIDKVGKPFAERIGDTRKWMGKIGYIRSNQGLAHYQGYGTPRANRHRLTPVNAELSLLVILCILKDCGFPEQFLTEVADRMDAPTPLPF